LLFAFNYAKPDIKTVDCLCTLFETRLLSSEEAEHGKKRFDRRKIRLIESNAKCRYPKKMSCKGTLQQVFYLSETPSPPLDRVVSKVHPFNYNQNYEHRKSISYHGIVFFVFSGFSLYPAMRPLGWDGLSQWRAMVLLVTRDTVTFSGADDTKQRKCSI
jgi:hypothetical protein